MQSKKRISEAGFGASLALLGVVHACGGSPVVEGRGNAGSTFAGRAGADGSGGSSASGGASATGGKAGAGGSAASGGAIGTAGTISVTMGGEAGEGGASCGASVIQAEVPIVNVLLVVDKSSSMNETSEFSVSRWTALGGALGTALEEAKAGVSFGLDLYPFADDPNDTPATCETPGGSGVLVPVGPGVDTVPDIVDALETYQPAGGTPTADALGRALDYFTTGAGTDLEGTNYVLLATDGGPNCNADLRCDENSCTINLENPMASMGCMGSCCDPMLDPAGPTNCLDEDRTVRRVEALADAGIRTFVVGIPGSQFFAGTLDRLAEAGGEPNPDAPPSYYAVTGADGAEGLAEVLTRITTSLITTCRLQLTSTPMSSNYEGLLNVVIDGQEVPQAGDDGWEVDRTTSPPTIVLKGATCEAMETRGAEEVEITYGCPTVMVPR